MSKISVNLSSGSRISIWILSSAIPKNVSDVDGLLSFVLQPLALGKFAWKLPNFDGIG